MPTKISSPSTMAEKTLLTIMPCCSKSTTPIVVVSVDELVSMRRRAMEKSLLCVLLKASPRNV